MDGWIFQFFVSLPLTLLFSGAWLPSHTFAIGDTHLCSVPLGMASGAIPDSALNASSFYVNSVGAQQARLNSEGSGGAWCPKEPIAIGVREWLQVSFNETQLISGVQVQGRYAKGAGQEYTEEFELEYWRDGFDVWRKYYRFDGKTVLPANSDTSTIITNKLRPPVFAKKIRIMPYSNHRRTVCLRLELLGCPWQGELMQYTMLQGDVFLEGISLRDESYDGQGSKWDRRVLPDQQQTLRQHSHHHEVQQQTQQTSMSQSSTSGGQDKENVVNIFHRPMLEHHHPDGDGSAGEDGDSFGEDHENESESSLDKNRREDEVRESERGDRNPDDSSDQLLTAGLGQLTDKIEGANSFTMDIGYGLGNGWVGWKRKKGGETEEYIEILFEFNSVRKFTSLDLYINNYPSKGVQTFSRAKVYFSIGGVHFNGRPLTFVPVSDVTLEHARNLTISLENRAGRFVRLHMYFRSTWIVVGEVYFHSEIYDGNYTTEIGPDAHVDFPDTQSPLEIGDLDSSMMETVVGIISGLILLLGIVAGLIIWMRRNGRSISSAFTFHPSAFPFWRTTWSSVPTHIVTQANPATEGVKDLLLTLTPLSNGGSGVGGGGAGGGGNNGHATVVVVNGDFKAHNPPAYSNGTLSTAKHSNGLHIHGSHYNNYGSTTTKSIIAATANTKSVENGSSPNVNLSISSGKMDNGLIGSTSTPSHRQHQHLNQHQHHHQFGSSTLTLRSNQLAALDEMDGEGKRDRDQGVDYEYEMDLQDDIYHEASTLSINNTTSRTRNRKMKVAASVWNLNSGGRSYRNHRGRLVPEVSLRQLRLIENLGSCLHGQVHLYDFEGEIACHEGTLYRNCRLIAKTIKSLSEIRLLSVLDHEHVLATIAVCSEMKKPLLALYPAPECGDLCSFLSRLSNTPSLSWLLNVGAQIASGMNYLESLSLIHRDLSARNCLVEREGSIRIADLAMACEQYRGDYCHTSSGLAPLRWWSWESILTDEFTMQSSVWSFGVTLWEILTLCRQKPLAHVTDHQITTLAEKYGSTATSQQTWLPQPLLSPPEIFDLMRECWQKNPTDRPTFQHIHLFLEQKCASTVYHAV